MYTGCLQMTLETKMNLCKLGKEDEAHGLPETEQVGYGLCQFNAPQCGDEVSYVCLMRNVSDDWCDCSVQNPGSVYWLTAMKSHQAQARQMKTTSLPPSSWGLWEIRAQRLMCMLLTLVRHMRRRMQYENSFCSYSSQAHRWQHK